MATVAQLRTAAGNAGFTGVALTAAVAIALAESGGNENASHRNSNGTTDLGAWQINTVHADLLAGKNPYDLQQNADMAYTLYRRRGSFADWTTAHTIDGKPPAYQQYLVQAQGGTTAQDGGKKHHGTFAGSSTLGDLASVGSDVATALNPVHDIESLIGAISEPSFWKRVGLGFLAFLLLLVGIIIMIESNKTVRSATTKAAETAAIA